MKKPVGKWIVHSFSCWLLTLKSQKGERQEKGRNEEGRCDRNKGSKIETDEDN